MNRIGKVLFAIVLVGILGFATYWGVRSQVKATAQSFLDKLFHEDVTYQFQAFATRISGKQRLHVAKLEQLEVIQRTTRGHALWLSLPTVITRLEVPVEYNYYVNVTAPWKFTRSGDELIVQVPELSAGTPAANISLLKLNVVKGNFFFNEESAKKKLQSEVHLILVENSISYRDRVREEARNSIHQFVTNWLLQLDSYPETSVKVRILFPGEELPRPRS